MAVTDVVTKIKRFEEQWWVTPMFRGFLVFYMIFMACVTVRILHYTQDASSANRNMPVIGDLLAGLSDAESGQRGFLYSGDSQYLTQYHQGSGLAKNSMILLTEFLDSDLEKPRVAELRQVVAEKLREMDQTVEFVNEGNAPAAKTMFGTGEGQRRMNRIKVLCEVLKAQELNRQFKASVF